MARRVKKLDQTGSAPDSEYKEVTAATKRKLASLSGNLCANPDCPARPTLLVDKNTQSDIGEAAHIAGEKKGAARFDPNMTNGQRNDISNLLYLCTNCHTKVDHDKEGRHYSVELLTQWKAQHEEKVQRLLLEGFASLGFPELEEATNWLLERTPVFEKSNPIPDFNQIAITRKIEKHVLSNESQHIILEACSRLNDVDQFIRERTIEDSTPPILPDRLKAGILCQYCAFMKSGQAGDELFTSMVQYMRKGFDRYAMQSASLSILVYYFEKCDIFSD